MKILEVAGSGTIGTNDMGPVSNVIFQLSNHFYELGHEVTIADARQLRIENTFQKELD